MGLAIGWAVELPLHKGKAPRWLYSRMVQLSAVIVRHIVDEYGEEEVIRRLADPLWFQALGSVLGFDWHSSGLTTTTCAALKEGMEKEGLGIAGAGGKGRAMLNAEEEIGRKAEEMGMGSAAEEGIRKGAKLTAKTKTALLQDGYQMYHHTVFFSKKEWMVVEQGMKGEWARRYHWKKCASPPKNESDIISARIEGEVLNLSGREKDEVHKGMVDIAQDFRQEMLIQLSPLYSFPKRHWMDMSKEDIRKLAELKEFAPKSIEEVLMFKGMGAKRIRALALLSSLIYGNELDWKDPAKYSFAHGGKDGIPYPVDREMYDRNVRMLREIVNDEGKKRWLKGLRV